jgi:hypothetical protein
LDCVQQTQGNRHVCDEPHPLSAFSASVIMPGMNEQQISRLESQLERLVEGAFAQLFGNRIRIHDLAIELARAMEDGLAADQRGQFAPVAPDHYTIHLHPSLRQQLIERQPALLSHLSEYLVDMATSAGYRLTQTPTIEWVADAEGSESAILVNAHHTIKKGGTTGVLKRVEVNAQVPAPLNAQLILNGKLTITLNGPIINVGRSRDNQVVIDDRSVSRYHLQLRLRHGRYLLFDTQSAGGTRVNEQPVKEHTLQNGDVIHIGSTQLIYVDDYQHHDGHTQAYSPAE